MVILVTFSGMGLSRNGGDLTVKMGVAEFMVIFVGKKMMTYHILGHPIFRET